MKRSRLLGKERHRRAYAMPEVLVPGAPHTQEFCLIAIFQIGSLPGTAQLCNNPEYLVGAPAAACRKGHCHCGP